MIHAASILIDILLTVSYCTTSRCVCPSKSCANNLRKLVDLLAGFYSQSSLPPVLLIGIVFIDVVLTASCLIR